MNGNPQLPLSSSDQTGRRNLASKTATALFAVVLTVLLAFGWVGTFQPKSAEAANSQQTAYVWFGVGKNPDGTDIPKKGFNVMGVSGGKPSIKTAYGGTYGNGYEVVAKVDGKQTSQGAGLAFTSNGQTVTYEGLQFKQNLSIVNDDAYVRVSYTVTNPTATSHVVSLGNWTDVQIGGNDKAPIEANNTGARMYESAGGNQFNMICKNAYGVTDVDTLWFGKYGESYANVFSGAKTPSVNNVDSGIAIGWMNRTIPAGESRTFSYLLGIGESADPPEINGQVNAKVNPQTVDVWADVRDKVGRTDRLYYVLDRDTELETEPAVLATHTFTANTWNKMEGVIQRPTTWQVGEVHTVSVWVMNEANAMSPIVTKVIVIKDDEEEGDVMQEGVNVNLHFKPGSLAGVAATGTPPADRQVFELQQVELPSNTFLPPVVGGMTMKFAGWKAQDGKMYQPGAKFTMPERTSIIDANLRTNYDFEAVWMSDGKSIYYIDIYKQQKDGTYKKTQELTEIGDENRTANISSRVSEFAQEGYRLHSGNPTKLSGTVAPITAATPLRLALYYDLEQFNVNFNVDDMPGLSDSMATLYYNTSLKDSSTASMRTLSDQQWATFGGWFNRTNGKGAQLTEDRRIKANETYYAYWSPKLKQMIFDYNYRDLAAKPAVTSAVKALEETRDTASNYANLGVKLQTGQLPAALPDWTDGNGKTWRFDKWVVDGSQVIGGRAGKEVQVTESTVFKVTQNSVTAHAKWFEVFPVTLTNTSHEGGTAALTAKNPAGVEVTLATSVDNVPATTNVLAGDAARITFAPKPNHQVAHVTVNGVVQDAAIGEGRLTLRDIQQATDVVVTFVKSPTEMTFDYAYADAEAGRTPADASLATKPAAKQGLLRDADVPGQGVYQNIALKTSGMPATPGDWKDTAGKAWRFDGWQVDGSFVIGGESGTPVTVDENTRYTIRYNAEAPLGYDDITAKAQWREVLPLTATCNVGGKVARANADTGQVVTSPYHEVGSNVAVTFSPNTGYLVSHVMVDGVWDDSWIDLGRVELPDYRQAHSVYVEFAKDPNYDPGTKETGSIQFNANGGTGTPAGISGEVGTSTAAHTFPLGTPVRAGYVFNGWNTQTDGKGIDVTSYPATFERGTTVYYAKWEKVDSSNPDPAPTPGVETGYVKFSANGGKGTPAGISGEVGTPITGKQFPVMVPQRDGYVFDGWNTAADGTGNVVTNFPASYPQGTVTYYAKWIEMGLNPDPDPVPGDELGFIRFDPNGGSGTPAGLSGKVGTSTAGHVFPATVPVRTGYVFEGWNTAADGTGEAVTSLPALFPEDGSTIIYYAKWSKAQAGGPVAPEPQAAYIKFDANGGTGTPAGIQGRVGDAVTAAFPATVPQKGTDVFQGWFTAPSGGQPVTSFPATLDTPGTTVYYAQWKSASAPAPVVPDDPDGQFTSIAFDSNGGNGTPGWIQGAPGDPIADAWPTLVPNRPGFVFLGWFTEQADDAGTQVAAYPSAFPDNDVTYFAHWAKLPDPGPDGPGPAPDPDPQPTDPDDPTLVSLMFNANGGNGTPANIDGAPGASTAGNVWPALVPLKTGFVFNGWFTAPEGGAAVTGLPAAFPAQDTVYYAQWLPAASGGSDPAPEPGQTYGHVKFDVHGGNGAPAALTGNSGDPITNAWPTTKPNRDGYVFMGWFDAATGGNEVQAYPATFPNDSTVVYHAQWSKIPGGPDPDPQPTNPDDPFNVSLMFNANGGNGTPANIDGAAGQPTTGKLWPSAVPQRAGYAFDGWFDAPEGGNRVAGLPATFPTADVTYYAHWVKADPDTPDGPVGPSAPFGYIRFDVTGGYGAPAGIQGEAGTSTSAYTFPTGTPLKSGYVFNGWNTAEDGSGAAVASYPATFAEGTVYYYAQWIRIEDPRNPDPQPGPGPEVGFIKFDANGGSGAPDGVSGPIGSDASALTFPVQQPLRAGHVFTGWNAKADGSGQDFTSFPATFEKGTTVLYAQWKAVDPAKPDPAPVPTPDPTPDPAHPTSWILFDANGGAGAPDQIAGEAGTSTSGSAFPLQRPVRAGHVFAGWNTASDGSGQAVTALPATFPPASAADPAQGTSVTYYAQWQAVDPTQPDPAPTPVPNPDPSQGTFAFDAQGGIGAPASQTGISGANVDAAFPGNVPSKSGHTFAGWNTAADGSGQAVSAYPATYPDGQTVVFYAQWKKADTGKPDPAPAPGTQPGYYKFDANGGQGTHPGISGEVGSSTAAHPFPSVVPQRVGFVFNGWNTASDGSGQTVTAYPATFVAGTTVFYAQWEQIYNPAEPDPAPEPGQQTGYIKFSANGGNGTPAGTEGTVGQAVTAQFPAMVPTKAGKSFAGWNTKADGTGQTVASYPATFSAGTTVYYAKWVDPVVEPDNPVEPEKADAYIKFSANGGSGAPAGISGKEGEATAAHAFPTAEPARTGHAFAGWNTKADGTGQTVSAYPATLAAGTTIYYAKWVKVDPDKPDPAPVPTPDPTPDPAHPTSWILFDANVGSGTPDQIAGEAGSSTSGNAFPVLKPVRTGYVFAGWNTASDGSGQAVTKLPAKFPPASAADPEQGTSVTYYAKWQPVDPTQPDPAPTPGPNPDPSQGTFAFDAQGGSGAPAAISGASGSTVRVAFPGNVPVKSGSVFAGWNTAADGSGQAVTALPDKFPNGQTVVYYAQWTAAGTAPDPEPVPEPERGYIKFDANGGTGAPATVSGTVGSAVTDAFPVDTPLRKNHSFNGWNTAADGSGTFVSAFDGDLAKFKQGTVILYAQWLQTAVPVQPDPDVFYTVTTELHGSTHATVTKTHSVAKGADTKVEWKPEPGYEVTEVTVNGIRQALTGQDGAGAVDFKGVRSNHTVIVQVQKIAEEPPAPGPGPATPTGDPSYVQVKTQIVGQGSIDPTASVALGANHTVSWTVDPGCEVRQVFINGVEVEVAGTSLQLNRYTFEKLAANATIKVVVAPKGSTEIPGTSPDSFDIYTNIINGEGTITPTKTLETEEQKKRHDVEWQIDVAKTVGSLTNTVYPKYEVEKVEVDKAQVEHDEANVKTFLDVDSDHQVDVYLRPNLVNVNVNVTGKGTASQDATLFKGQDYAWFAKAEPGWHLEKVTLRDSAGETVLYQKPGSTFSLKALAADADAKGVDQEVVEDKRVDVLFVRDDGTVPSPDEPTHDVTVQLAGALAAGSIGSNYHDVAMDDSRTVSWTLNDGFYAKKVTVDRGGVVQVYNDPDFSQLTLESIETDVTVTVEVAAKPADVPGPDDPKPVDPEPDPEPQPTDPDDPSQSSIMFSANGGSGAPANIDGPVGAAVTAAFPTTDPVRTGHAFAGWFTEKDGGMQVTALPGTFPEASVTYYAHWLKNPDPVTPAPNPADERYDLTTSITTGQGDITNSARNVVKGEKVTVSWTANHGSYVSKVVVDGVERNEYVYQPGQPASKRGMLTAGSITLTMNDDHDVQVTLAQTPAMDITVNGEPADQIAVITYGDPVTPAVTQTPFGIPAGTKVTYHYTPVDDEGARLGQTTEQKPTEVGFYQVYASAPGQTDSPQATFQIVPRPITVAATYPVAKAPAGLQMTDAKGGALTADSYGYRVAQGKVLTSKGLASGSGSHVKQALDALLGKVVSRSYEAVAPATGSLSFAKPEPGTYRVHLTFANQATAGEPDASGYCAIGNYLVKFADADVKIEKGKLAADVVDAKTKKSSNYFTEGQAYDPVAKLGSKALGAKDGVTFSYAKRNDKGGFDLIGATKPTKAGRYLLIAEGDPRYFDDADPVPYTIYAKTDPANPTNPDNPVRETRHIEVAAKFAYPAIKSGFNVSAEPYTYQMVPGYSLLAGDTLEGVLGSVTYTCKSASGVTLDRANPKAGIYTLTPSFSKLKGAKVVSKGNGTVSYKLGDYEVTVRSFQIVVVDEPKIPEKEDPKPPVLPDKPDPEKGDPTPPAGEDGDLSYIKFDANGGFGAPEGIVGDPEQIITDPFPTQEPSVPGYEFTGWNTEPDGTGEDVTEYPGKFSAQPGTTYYYAQWKRDKTYVPPVDPGDPDGPGADKPAKKHVVLVGYFDPSVSKAGVDIAKHPYQVYEVPGFNFAEGDTLKSVLGDPEFQCQTSYGTELNRTKPISGDYVLKPLFPNLGEPVVNEDGSYRYETDDYVITVLPQNVYIEPVQFNDDFVPEKDEPVGPEATDVDVKVTVTIVDGKPVVDVTIDGKPLPGDYTYETEYFKWNEDTEAWDPIGGEAPTDPGYYKVVVTVYDGNKDKVGEAWTKFRIPGPDVPAQSEPGNKPSDKPGANGTGGQIDSGLGKAQSDGAQDGSQGGAQLAKTGDVTPVATLAFAAAIALAALALLRRRNRNDA